MPPPLLFFGVWREYATIPAAVLDHTMAQAARTSAVDGQYETRCGVIAVIVSMAAPSINLKANGIGTGMFYRLVTISMGGALHLS